MSHSALVTHGVGKTPSIFWHDKMQNMEETLITRHCSIRNKLPGPCPTREKVEACSLQAVSLQQPDFRAALVNKVWPGSANSTAENTTWHCG